jgi:hypothetical protein
MAGVVVLCQREETMAGWYPGWQILLAWLFVTAVAALYYFAPVAQLVAELD